MSCSTPEEVRGENLIDVMCIDHLVRFNAQFLELLIQNPSEINLNSCVHVPYQHDWLGLPRKLLRLIHDLRLFQVDLSVL